MPSIDYFLTTSVELTKEDISSGNARSLSKHLDLGKDKRTWNKKQLQALTLILCNLVSSWREDDGEFLYPRDKKTVANKFNPLGIGYSSLYFVIDKLIEAKLLTGTIAPQRKLGEKAPKLLSNFIVTPRVLKFAYELGITDKTIHVLKSPHVRLRNFQKHLVSYKPNAYTKYIETQMHNYCEYLNQQSIMLKTNDRDGEGIIEYGSKLGGKHIHLHRNYKTWTDVEELIPHINKLNIKIPNYNFNLGGRSGGYWHSIKKDDRPTILINGNKTKAADFPCSHINICYKFETNNWYQQETYKELKEDNREQEDAYIISSAVHRDLSKYMVQLMFNVKGRSQVSRKFNDWIDRRNKNSKDNASKEQQQFHRRHNFTNMQLMEMIENKHAKIKDYFYKGKLAGQIIQWEEANLVFNIANQFINEHDVTTLTVHDELIVEEKHYQMAKEFMYTSGYSEVCTKYSLMNRIKHM